jgi:hypothetical protein
MPPLRPTDQVLGATYTRVAYKCLAEAALLAINPAPTVAVPASSPFFINERRLLGRTTLSVPGSFKIVPLQFGYLVIVRYRQCDSALARVLDFLRYS